MPNHFQRGTILLELLITLSLVVLLATFAFPNLIILIEKNRLTTRFDEYQNALQEARTLAIQQGRTIEVCAYKTDSQCGADWNNGWILRAANAAEPLRLNVSLNPEGSVRWSGYSKTIRFRSNGSSPTSNGRLIVCGHNELIGQLIINRQGRVRHGTSEENHNELSRCL